MPGIQDSGPSAIAAPNLVTQLQPTTPVVTTDSVRALTDAFRQGQITAGDIIDRVGILGKAKKKAELSIAESQGSPEAAAARQSALVASAQQSQLAGNTAGAEQSMLPAHTQLAAGQLAQGMQEMQSGMPAATVRQLNLIYNLGAKFNADGTITNPDEVFPNLTHVMGSLNGMQVAKELGTRVKTENVTDKNGAVHNVPTWSATGKPLAPDEKAFFDRYQSMVPGMIKGAPEAVVSPRTAAPAPTKPSVTPASGAAATGVVTPATPEGDAGGAWTPPLDAQGNLVTKQLTTIEKNKAAMDMSETARKQKAVQDWRTASSFYGNAKDAMSAINAVSLADQNSGKVNLNQRDVELAEAVVKMLDPEGAVREFKWGKLEDGQPIMEQVHSVMAKITKAGQFTPGVRQELMKVANGAMRSRESQAADLLKGAAASGGAMTDMEKSLVSGNATPVYTPPSAAATPGAGASAGQSFGGKTWEVGGSYSVGGRTRQVTGFEPTGRPIFAP